MSFNIILTPLWSASTDAYTKGDLDWIKRSMNHMMKVSMVGSFAIIFLIFSSSTVYRLWIGDGVVIPFKLNLWMGLYTMILIWSTCFSTFLFGIGKLKAQLLNTLAVSILFIPLAVLLTKYFGITGMAVALCLTNLSGMILNPIQYQKIISGKATGVWNK